MPVYDWSQTSSSNASADPSINWAEGQAPSSVNDSARAMMAAVAQYRDDISGAIVTTGNSTAYAVTSYSGYDTLAHLANHVIAFSPHTTNVATVTLNVDSLGAKPLRSSPGVELLAGTIIQGTPYLAVYNNSDGAFYLQGFYGNPYNVPLAGGMDFWGATVPNSSFAFPIGQAISRTTYSTLFSIMSTTYGSGDGSTTFNLPDKTGRITAMKESSATRLTSTYFGGNSTTLGAVGGTESHTLSTTEIPSHQHAVFLHDPGHVHTGSYSNAAQSPAAEIAGGSNTAGTVNTASATTGITIGSVTGTGATDNQTATIGGGGAHAIVQPTIICNYIIRIL